MGRNILRRYILTSSLFVAAISHLSAVEAEPQAVRHVISYPGQEKTAHLPPRKGLRSDMIFQYPFEMNDTIRRYVEYYTSKERLAYLQRALDRAAPFRVHIEKAIAEKKLPRELFYLTLVESAFRIDAVSRSGAVGLWQFMLNSIDPYDITVDDWRDDRRDFWRSTDAALDKLKYNYEKTGSWDLALAAYNCGLNGLRKITTSSGIDDYWLLARKGLLPGETSRYLAKFLAITIVCSYGGRYGLESGWESEWDWDRIELGRPVDLKLLAEESGIDYSLLSLANAELIYHVTPPADSGYALKIPAQYADSLKKILKSSDMAFMKFYRYNIRTGDTLSEISDYYRVPLSVIYRYNDNLSPMRLRPGQIVIIPALADVTPYRKEDEVDVSFPDTYVVRKGDSLWSISGRYSISPELLASRNRLPVDGILNIGMKLSVPALE